MNELKSKCCGAEVTPYVSGDNLRDKYYECYKCHKWTQIKKKGEVNHDRQVGRK